MTRACASGLLASLALAACAYKPPEPQSPQPSSTQAPGYNQQPYPAQPAGQPTSQPTYAQPPPPPPTATFPTPGGTADPSRKEEAPKTMAEAVGQLDSEARRLESGLSSCELACKALGSMERAVRVVCELARGDERPRCDDARSRLREARTRVRNACGQCQNGPRTDTDAPDP